MFLDSLVQLAAAQAVTSTAAGTATFDVSGLGSGTVYNGITGGLNSDLLGFDIGAGDGIAIPTLYWNVTTAFVSAGSATLQIGIQAAPDNGSGSAGTYQIITETAPLTPAQLALNANGQFAIPPVGANWVGEAMPRFYQVEFTVATSTFSSGAISANIVLNPQQAQKIQKYPSNYVA